MYKEKIVCFIDILGFGRMIDREYLDRPEIMHSILSKIRESINDWGDTAITEGIDLQITQFSDCIVFSFLPTKHYFMTFNFFKELAVKMISQKIVFRGGITYGKVFHDSELIFGPAMNCAYRLESEEANYPRIIIDQAASTLKNDEGKTIADYSGQFVFRIDESEYSYIDYIIDVVGYTDQAKFYEALRSMISAGLLSEAPRVKEKYEWMKSEYNQAIRNYSNLNSL
jgi:hypothetical protein